MSSLRDHLRFLYQRTLVLPRISRTYKALSTAETFSRIYATHAWGTDGRQGFSSGNGSRGAIAEEYCSWLTAFIREKGFRSVADLGSGDFYVGSRVVVKTGIEFACIDIVADVTSPHARSFLRKGIPFHSLDIVKARLSSADFCMIRHVFQHLSNAEITV